MIIKICTKEGKNYTFPEIEKITLRTSKDVPGLTWYVLKDKDLKDVFLIKLECIESITYL